jgi:uncharacterized protein with gpF-like domain
MMADTINNTMTQLGLPTVEQIIEIDLNYLFEYTNEVLVGALTDMINEGKTVEDVKQSLIDAGIFNSNRALTAARTMAGTATSVGQLQGGVNAGATHKTWHDSGFDVRDAHVKRNGETVEIDKPFSAMNGETVGPMYPGDPNTAPADRINCRCSMTFEIRD